jgi:hypothetical protein
MRIIAAFRINTESSSILNPTLTEVISLSSPEAENTEIEVAEEL